MKSLNQKRIEGIAKDKNNSIELYWFYLEVLKYDPKISAWLAGHVVDVKDE